MPSLPAEIEIYSAETTGLEGREGGGAYSSLVFERRCDEVANRSTPGHHPLYFSKVRAPSGIQMAVGGWRVAVKYGTY